MSEAVKCKCGACVAEISAFGEMTKTAHYVWFDEFGGNPVGTTDQEIHYCPDCGDRLSVVEGVPIAEPMVPASGLATRDRALDILRAALDNWVKADRGDLRSNYWPERVRAALAAAEEATPDATPTPD